MNQIFEFNSTDVVELISGNEFHVSREKSWVKVCVREACLDLTPGDTDLV